MIGGYWYFGGTYCFTVGVGHLRRQACYVGEIGYLGHGGHRSNDHLELGMGKRRRDWADKCKPVCPEKENNTQAQVFLKRPLVRTIKR
jgi:hypothetical protein